MRPSSALCRNGRSAIFIRRWIYRNSWRTFRARTDECKAFAEEYRGKLASLAAQDFADPQSHLLTQAVRRYEALDDLTGKIGSYASLVYSGDTSPIQARVKFYGDTQEKLNAAWTELLFFQLELNRLDDEVLAHLTAHTNRSRITAPGSKISARRSRTNSPTTSSVCSTKNR